MFLKYTNNSLINTFLCVEAIGPVIVLYELFKSICKMTTHSSLSRQHVQYAKYEIFKKKYQILGLKAFSFLLRLGNKSKITG